MVCDLDGNSRKLKSLIMRVISVQGDSTAPSVADASEPFSFVALAQLQRRIISSESSALVTVAL